MQFFRHKRYRFFYPVGLISLVLLPVLGLLYLHLKGVFNQKYVKELNIINPERLTLEPYNLPDPRFSRNYKKVELTGEHEADKQKLDDAQAEIRRMLDHKDTLNGVQIIYGPKANYASMIRGLDICLIENARTYLLYKTTLWVFYLSPKTNPITSNNLTSCILYDDVVIEKPKVTYSTLFLNEWNETKVALQNAKPFWPAAILYLIMVALTTQKAVRQIQRPILNH